jgi:hypothetical protein
VPSFHGRISLVREKNSDVIVVKEILDRANERILWFNLPILKYHDEHPRKGAARTETKRRATPQERPRKVLAEPITDDVRKSAKGAGKRPNCTGSFFPECCLGIDSSPDVEDIIVREKRGMI